MRIQYCSDLHLEFDHNNKYISKNPLSVCGEILILAGDIVPLHDEFFSDSFIRVIGKNYKQVFWVPGNHEYYHKDLTEFGKSTNIKLTSNISIVNNIELVYENIQFIFSTLWSEISSDNEKLIEQSVSDFECILNNDRKIRADDFNKLHNESIAFIRQSLNERQKKSVVVTHHVPSALCNSSLHKLSLINEAFCVDLTDYINECNANFWIYGHSHFNRNPLYIGNTILLTNQLGYVHCNEHNGFRHNAYFSL
jgi:Icc-related predicted phosphoesterase